MTAPTHLVHHYLEKSALRDPCSPAVFAEGRWHTYDEVETASNRMAHLLISKGIRPGDRVALMLENSFAYVVAYYGILKAGAVTVAFNTESLAGGIHYMLDNCGVSILITQQKFLSRIQSIPSFPATLARIFIWNPRSSTAVSALPSVPLPSSLESESTSPPDIAMDAEETASIVYTSGSTGKSRGVTLTHGNITANTESIVSYLRLTAKDRVMVVLPFFYIYGKSLLNTHFAVGGSVVIDNRFLYPNVILKTMREQQATGFAGVPSTFGILLHRSMLASLDFPSLRYVTQAGGAMAPALQKETAAAFSPAKLYVMYGATEASARLSYLDPKDLPQKWGSIGKAIPGVELFVAAPNGHPLPPGTEGELVARGANIMQGYWNQPDETKEVLKNGLYYTGDIGIMDDEGFLYIIGRKRDMIKVGGNRVSAKEIEDALYEHPDIVETAVIARNDDILGESIKAFIVLKSGSGDEPKKNEIKQFLASRIAPYKIPQTIAFLSTLPKNESGKILKLKLK